MNTKEIYCFGGLDNNQRGAIGTHTAGIIHGFKENGYIVVGSLQGDENFDFPNDFRKCLFLTILILSHCWVCLITPFQHSLAQNYLISILIFLENVSFQMDGIFKNGNLI